MKNESGRGGSWEDLGRGWSTQAKPQAGRIRARYYEDDGQIIYGPNGEALSRVVDRDLKMGFRHGERS